MLRIIKLHVNLFKFLRKEAWKKRKPAIFVKFWMQIIVAYGKALLSEYRHMFLYLDSSYRKEKRKFEKFNELKKTLQKSLKMLKILDKKMAEAGFSRQSRRQFWRDFYKNGKVRNDVFDKLINDLK